MAVALELAQPTALASPVHGATPPAIAGVAAQPSAAARREELPRPRLSTRACVKRRKQRRRCGSSPCSTESTDRVYQPWVPTVPLRSPITRRDGSADPIRSPPSPCTRRRALPLPPRVPGGALRAWAATLYPATAHTSKRAGVPRSRRHRGAPLTPHPRRRHSTHREGPVCAKHAARAGREAGQPPEEGGREDDQRQMLRGTLQEAKREHQHPRQFSDVPRGAIGSTSRTSGPADEDLHASCRYWCCGAHPRHS
uniref:Uncharacterized protein n=1 Tax=Setaria viridis TaxID=4556 RepID=A0A4U6V3M7_SETVI|nr:hypothetical protein SEVIR_4G160300v2 [Setaria viridis]